MAGKGIPQAQKVCQEIIDSVAGVFVGNRLLLSKVLAAGLANGHILFEDYPGLGKTLLIKLFAITTGCAYSRIQFTPDLLPSDILGTKIWHQKESTFEFMKGPIFANILLADEINRTPPKTQSALLEAMEERNVTIEGNQYTLPSPFFVLATQNPIEQEGTYPLPEAQMDRFMLRMSMGYVDTLEEEVSILKRRLQWKKDDPSLDTKPVITEADFMMLQKQVENDIYIDPCILEYIGKIVRLTREHPKVEIGSSPRGGLALVKVSRAMALINGRDFVTPDDVKMFVIDALAHRIILEIEEIVEGTDTKTILDEVVEQVPVPKEFYPK
jgi:MoxR-like ATPase